MRAYSQLLGTYLREMKGFSENQSNFKHAQPKGAKWLPLDSLYLL